MAGSCRLDAKTVRLHGEAVAAIDAKGCGSPRAARTRRTAAKPSEVGYVTGAAGALRCSASALSIAEMHLELAAQGPPQLGQIELDRLHVMVRRRQQRVFAM